MEMVANCWIMKEFFEKKNQHTKSVRGVEKYNILILLGYQSIHDKNEQAHEIFILIALYIKLSFIHACTAIQWG